MSFFPVLDDGILSESKWLLDLGLMPNSNSATRAIGYRQVNTHLLCCIFLKTSSWFLWIFFDLRNGAVEEKVWFWFCCFSNFQAMEYLLRSREDRGWNPSRDFYSFLSDFQKASRLVILPLKTIWFSIDIVFCWQYCLHLLFTPYFLFAFAKLLNMFMFHFFFFFFAFVFFNIYLALIIFSDAHIIDDFDVVLHLALTGRWLFPVRS